MALSNIIQQYGLDSNRFRMTDNGGVGLIKPQGYENRPTDLILPSQYFTSGMYNSDMKQYGHIYGPGGIFNAMNGDTGVIDPQFDFDPTTGALNTGYHGQNNLNDILDREDSYNSIDNTPTFRDPNQVVGSVADQLGMQYNAYKNLLNGTNTTTDFSHIPSQLGTDVMNALANGNYTSLFSGDEVPKQQGWLTGDGRIHVADSNSGMNLYYNKDGSFEHLEPMAKDFGPLKGLAAVAGSALSFGALGALAAGGSIGLGSGIGLASLVPKQILPDAMQSQGISASQLGLGGSKSSNGASMANVLPSFGGLSSLIGSLGNIGKTSTIDESGAFGGGSGGFDLEGLLNGIGGGLGNLGNALGGANGLLNLGGGLLGAQQQGNAADRMMDFLNNQQKTMQDQTAGAQQKFMDFLNGQQNNLSQLGNQARDSILSTLGIERQADANLAQQGQQNTLNTLNQQQNQIGQLGAQGRDSIMNWLAGQQANINNLYNPGTPEANLMQQEMERKDAAAGRNSQYGVRATDLAGKLAGIKGDLNTRFATGVAGTVGNAQSLPANLLNNFATSTASTMNNANQAVANNVSNFDANTAGQMANANNLPVNTLSQFAQSAIPSLNNSLNQSGSNTLNFTTGTSKALSDALTLRANRFNSLLSGAADTIRRQQGTGGSGGTGGSSGAGGSGGLGSIVNSVGGLSKLFGDTFGGIAANGPSLTGMIPSDILPGQGFNFGAPILDSNGIGSIGNSGIQFGSGVGGFGSSLDQFIGGGGSDLDSMLNNVGFDPSSFGDSIPNVSDVFDWFL